jgi:hypothetical protein
MENLRILIILFFSVMLHFGSSIRNKNENKKFEESEVQLFTDGQTQDQFMSYNPNIFGNFFFSDHRLNKVFIFYIQCLTRNIV